MEAEAAAVDSGEWASGFPMQDFFVDQYDAFNANLPAFEAPAAYPYFDLMDLSFQGTGNQQQ